MIEPYIQGLIEKLPPEIAIFRDKYPIIIGLVAEYWNYPIYSPTYIPTYISFNYTDAYSNEADLVWHCGRIIRAEKTVLQKTELTAITFDDALVYVEIEGREIFNKIERVIYLPQLLKDPGEGMVKILIEKISDISQSGT